MYKNLIKSRLLCSLRAKDSVFWLLLFPILLSILFYAGLSNVLKGESFELVNVAVVKDAAYDQEMVMPNIISSVSADSKSAATKDTLFVTKYVSQDEAEKLLKDKKVSAYIYFEDGCHVVMSKNGMEQTIVKKFLDVAEQKTKVIQDIIEKNNGAMPNNMAQLISDSKEYIVDATNNRDKPDTTVMFFYSILGMVCMYGASTGCYSIMYLQSNQSAIAKRNCVSPVSKFKLLTASFISDSILSCANSLLVFAFMAYGLRVDFGDRYLFIILTNIVGAIMGLSFGYFIGSLSKKDINFKVGTVIGISMLCSFLAGMMDETVKYSVKQKAYIIDRLNPVNLITESFYKLYYYKSLTKYYQNIAILCIMTIVLVGATVFILNRQETNNTLERVK